MTRSAAIGTTTNRSAKKAVTRLAYRTMLRALDVEQCGRVLREGGLFIDLREVPEYLRGHIRGSIPIQWEPGPGFTTRARDLLPLDAGLILLDDGASPLEDAAEGLRGKGFDAAGYLPRGASQWPLATTPVVTVDRPGAVTLLLNVGDPGTIPRGEALRLPAEHLWGRAGELERDGVIGVLAGWGVVAAAAIGILEHLGFPDPEFVRTRPEGSRPPVAGPDVFRAGGPP